MRGRAHGSRKNGFLLTGLRAISSALSRHRSRRLRVRISVGFSTKRHEFRRFDAVRSWLPIDRRRCQTNYLLPPPTPLPAPPLAHPLPAARTRHWQTFHELLYGHKFLFE